MQLRVYIHKIRSMLLIALPVALSLLFLFPNISQAHAILLRSDPAPDAKLTSAPNLVRMWFSEDLSPGFSTATVVTSANKRIDANNAHVTTSDAREMDVSLQPDLSPGSYVVLWNTQSAADGHILRGSFIFNILDQNGKVPGGSGQNIANGSTNPNQFDAQSFFNLIVVTLVDLCAIFWVGAQLWRIFVLQLTESTSSKQGAIEQRTEQRFDRSFSLPVLLVLFLANICVLLGQALVLTGGNLGQAPSILGNLATNGRFGMYWIIRELVVFLAIVLAAITLLRKNLPQQFKNIAAWLNLILGMALLIALTMSGHAAAASANILVYSVMVDWLHLLAASLWIGGMLYIACVYLPAMKENTAPERAHSLTTTLAYYSPLAITGVIIMAVTGPFNAAVHLTSLNQLVTIAYGRALTVKVVLVGALLLTSAIHVGLLRPRLKKDYAAYLVATEVKQREMVPSDTTSNSTELASLQPLETRITRQVNNLSSILRWEPSLGVAVLVCTGLMNVFAGTLLPAAASQPTQQLQPTPTVISTTILTKPFTATLQTSDKKFNIKLSVSPNKFGPNVFTVTVFDSNNGAQDTKVGVSVYTTMLDMDMGTTPINLQPDGKGNFSAPGDLDMSGNWGLRIQIRAPDNKLHETTVKFVTTF